MVTRSYLKLVQPGAHAVEQRGGLSSEGSMQYAGVERALAFVEPLYRGRNLPSGNATLSHVLDSAKTLCELRLDPDAVAAAILYPAYATGGEVARAIREQFGTAVAELADGVVRMAQIGALTSRD